MVLVVGPGLLRTAANIVQGWQELLEDQVVEPLALRCCDGRLAFFVVYLSRQTGRAFAVLKGKGCSSDFMLMGIGGDARQARNQRKHHRPGKFRRKALDLPALLVNHM